MVDICFFAINQVVAGSDLFTFKFSLHSFTTGTLFLCHQPSINPFCPVLPAANGLISCSPSKASRIWSKFVSVRVAREFNEFVGLV
jgi:hypothetical protein